MLGLLFGMVFMFLPHVLLSIMTLDTAALDAACLYLRIAGGLMIFQAVEIVQVNLCRSLGRIKAPLVINTIANLVNVIGNYLVIFHPEWLWNIDPVAGVALATVLSRVAALIVALIVATGSGLRYSLRYLHPFPKADFKLVLSIGIPGGINSMAYSLGQIVTTSIISSMSLTLVSAKVYVGNVVQYIYIIGQAFASASAIMVGYRLGAGNYDDARKVQRIVTTIALLSNGILSLVIIALRYPMLRLFTEDVTIINMAANIFFLDFFVEIGRALNHCFNGALQAAGDVKFQLVVNQGSAWVLSVGGTYLLGVVFGLGLYGVWIAFACDELIRGSILVLRWRSGGWLTGAKAKREIIASKTPER
jgi:putative MATE family efflux protein